MDDFFTPFDLETALQIEQLARLVFETRTARGQVLARYQVEDEAALLREIETGRVEEHPAYEHYLGACILQETYLNARETMAALTQKANQ